MENTVKSGDQGIVCDSSDSSPSQVGNMDLSWGKRDTSDAATVSTRASSKETSPPKDVPVDVPDVEKGKQNTDTWTLEEEAPPGKMTLKSFIPELSWYLQTKHGKQHIKEVVMDQNNWKAGVTVALVSVPLSISLGIASGTTPMRGIACAIFGGLCAGIFGSSDYNIVGPAGALSGMLTSYVIQWGEDCLPWISIMSSVICLACLALRLDTFMLLMPNSVFEGFTVAVALIIGLNQINFACGLSPDKKHKLFIMNIVESIKTLDETTWSSLILFLLSAPTLWFLMRKIPKIPWTVLLPVVSIPIGFLADPDRDHLGFDLLTLKSKYGMLEPEIVQPLRSSDATFVDLLIPSFSVAIVAVLETLISAKIAAGRVDRDFKELGEMRGLVIAHAVCGVTGGMPPTGVFVRTSLNVSLGATHRFSQTLNACVVAIISLALMPVFSYIPQPTIAAILVVASVRMFPRTYLMKLWREDKSALALCLVTAAVCVGEDPVIGLAVGMAIALLAQAKKLMRSPFVDIKSKPSGSKKVYNISLHGPLTYINAETLTKKTRKLEDAAEVSLDLSGVRQVDHDGISTMGKLADKWVANNEDCKVYVKGVSTKLYPALSKFAWFTIAEDQGRVMI